MRKQDADVMEQRYLNIWVAMLNGVLSWRKERTLEWAKRWKPLMRNEMFFHAGPAYYAAHAMVEEEIKRKIGAKRLEELLANIERAIVSGNVKADFDVSQDWSLIKKRVDDLISRL